MSNLGENFGLDDFMDTQENAEQFYRFILNRGKTIPNYYGYPYIFKSLGKPEYFVRIEPGEDGRYAVSGFDSHCTGSCIWNMVHSGIDLTPGDSPKLSRVLLLRREGGQGLVPIELITADVCPSFLEGDRFKIQVVGLPLHISYHADEDAYTRSLPIDDEGQTWGVENGALFPAAFLYNHFPEHYEAGADTESDKIVSFMGTVKRLQVGYINITGEGYPAFLRCYIDTEFGELELDHTLLQIDPEQKDYIKPGAVVSGECIISGDLAIDEYENGIIKDHEHDLRLLRYSFLKGEEERLRSVLAENVTYTSETTGKALSGADEIIGDIGKVRKTQKEQKTKMIARLATITETEEGTEYPVGTRCFVLAYSEEGPYEAITFIDVNDSGEIEKIKISADSRYRFKEDDESSSGGFWEDQSVPESVEEAMFLKVNAVLAIRPWEESLEEFHAASANREAYRRTAESTLEKANYFFATGPLERVETLFANLFAGAFAGRLLKEIGAALPEPEIAELFEEEMGCPLGSEWEARFQKALDNGRMCFKSYKDYCALVNQWVADDRVFLDAEVMTQELGEAYAVKYLGSAPIEYVKTEPSARKASGDGAENKNA